MRHFFLGARDVGSGPISWARAVGDLVLARTCAGCGVESTWWCERCDTALAGEPVRVALARPVVGAAVALDLQVVCHAVASYHGAAGAALVAVKERGVGALVAPLADALARSVRASLLASPASGSGTASGPVTLVPAPSRPAAVRCRGADIVAVVARAAARSLRASGADASVLRCLIHTRAVADQVRLDADGRASNLAGALRVRPLAAPLLAGRTVVVVDDVVTTGATLREAVRALTPVVGAEPLVAATVATAGRIEPSGPTWRDPVVRSGAEH